MLALRGLPLNDDANCIITAAKVTREIAPSKWDFFQLKCNYRSFFHFSHQMAEEACSKQVVVRTLSSNFQMIEDIFVLNQLLPHIY